LINVSALPSRTTVMLRLNCHGAPISTVFIAPVTKKTSGNISSSSPCGKAGGN